jgi:hypothetical protein
MGPESTGTLEEFLLNMGADHQICCKNHLFCCAAQRQLIYLSAHIWGYITLFWPIWYCLAIATYGTFIVS